jgi:hypothetical protein
MYRFLNIILIILNCLKVNITGMSIINFSQSALGATNINAYSMKGGGYL